MHSWLRYTGRSFYGMLSTTAIKTYVQALPKASNFFYIATDMQRLYIAGYMLRQSVL